MDGVDGGHAEPGRQNPVECGRRPPALDVAEDRDPRLEAGAMLDLAREEIGDASEPLMTVDVDLAFGAAIVPGFGRAPSATTTMEA